MEKPNGTPDLDYMQRYLAHEMVDMYREGSLNRRSMLRRLVGICGGGAAAASFLAACGESTSGTADAAASLMGPDGGMSSADAAPAPGSPDAGMPADVRPSPGDVPRLGALSVSPDDPAVDGADIKYMGDVELFGYLARPRAAATGPRFGVVVVHENRGLTDHIRDVARRLAKAGYVALAPDLGSRGGGTPKIGDMISAFLGDRARRPDLIKDLSASLDHLAKQAGVNADKLGAVGFCYGGGMTWEIAAANPKVAAAVPYYGPIPNPIDALMNTKAAILAHYAETDMNVNGVNNANITATEKILKDAGKTFEKRIHIGARHGFNNDTGGAYDETEAGRAWADTLAWFSTHLKA